MTHASSTLPNLQHFDCEGDPTSIGTRWEKWKRAFEIYLLAANIETPVKKRATLLHVGGIALQEVYYNIPGAHVEEEGVDVYEVALKKLDSHFAPKQSRIYERYLFRLMKQEEEEQFERFLLRLRTQAEKCQFYDKEQHIIDQITEKCRQVELRKKILEGGDTITLDEIISKANALEVVARQLDKFKMVKTNDTNNFNKAEINKIDNKKKYNKPFPRQFSNTKCSRCGSPSHSSEDIKCPAKDKRCLKCGFIGHFRENCRTRQKRQFSGNRTETVNKKPKIETKKGAFRSEIDYIFNLGENGDKKDETGEVRKEKTEESRIDYIFHLDDDETIKCSIGGVTIDILIDSGSKCNVITDKTWQLLKDNRVKISNQIRKPNKTLVSYGSKEPLDIMGSFDANISVIANKCIKGTIYVIRNGTRDLLGKETAIQLGVLKIGLQINSISNEKPSDKVFPKFKGVTVQIPIDQTVKPVIQPYRRVPIPLEEKVTKKLKELKDADIIEEVNEPSPWVSPMVPVLKEGQEEANLPRSYFIKDSLETRSQQHQIWSIRQ
ncbi:uncharacterized protein LOC123871475 isoform X2 [Maniola jurtina]|uniref:uncharacterized protein LOC123871475 isoform X2 n=1 Tax=Maniola jurtina TaxID=191418 RepID=UPI001E68C50C|nr:uncharacterized protein LOC123871475 isoform X2 [Maniola jurtina]